MPDTATGSPGDTDSTRNGIAAEKLLDQLAGAATSRNVIEGLLGGIAARIGASAPKFDAEGILSLTVGQDVSLSLLHQHGLPGLVVAADMPGALVRDEDLLADLLAANLDWRRVGGATFGKLPEGGQVVLCQLLPITATDAADEAASRLLEESLLDFATTADKWIDDLEQMLDLGDDGSDPTQPQSRAKAPQDYA